MSEGVPDHVAAAEAFAERVVPRYGAVEDVLLFGSVARGEANGIDSDVDILVVLGDEDTAPEFETLHEIAYDVGLDYGVAVSLHVCTVTRFVEGASPFLRSARTSARSMVDPHR